MKSKRLLALLLTLLLTLSCTIPVLAVPGDGVEAYMLSQFEINLPELPSTTNTVADVLGTKSATAILSSVTYNNGKTGLTYADASWRLYITYRGNRMQDTDTFVAGGTYNFCFTTYLPQGMDIDNSLINQVSEDDIRLNLPVYINGIPGEDIVIFYHPEWNNQMSINARYTVPAPKFMDTFDVLGLKLPEAGMTVRDSLAKVSIKGMTKHDAEWRTGDADFRKLSPSEKFEAGKTYALAVSAENDGITYNSDSNNYAIMTPLLDGKAAEGAMIVGGIKMNSLPTFNWRYTIPAGKFMDTFDVLGLKLPQAGMTAKESLANVSVKDMTVYKTCWMDVANNFKELSPNDTFQPGKEYALNVSVENSGITYNSDSNKNAIMTTLMDGKPAEGAVIAGGVMMNSLPTFNWRYTVPSLITTYEGAVKEVRFYGLTTPCDGEKVSESYINAYVYFDSPYNTKKILKVEWEELDKFGNATKLSDDDHFQKGKTYQLHVYVDPGSDIFNTGYDPGIVFSWYAAETYLNNTKVSNGTGGEPAFLSPSSNNSVEFFNSYTCIEPVKAASGRLNEVRIEGLAMPADGMTLYQSLTDCVAKGLTITSMSWQELTPDGHVLEPMSNTDRFKGGTEYLLSIYMDAENLKLDEQSSPAPNSWVVASVYLNGDLVYNGDPGWSIVSGLDIFCDSSATPSKQLLFMYHYTATGSAPAASAFTDVASNAWYKDYVDSATQMGLINGMTPTTYDPDGTLTMAQAVKLAACMHQRYTTGKVTLTNGSPLWYQTYAEYARDNGIIAGSNPTAFEIGYNNVMDEPNKIITRQEYAWIFARALPKEALPEVNRIPDNAIPDVPQTMSAWYDSIYTLYRAGIVNGNDAKGTFNPLSNIKRSEVAAIVVRMMDKGYRVAAPAELGK